MSCCTWKACDRPAAHQERGRDGSVWAELCEKHHVELDEAVASLEPKRLMRSYILAQGGAAAAARRV